MSKYYKPEVEEIRIGLECVWSTLDNAFKENSFLKPENHWEDDICVGELEGCDIQELLALYDTFQDVAEQIRVKYLDGEDLSSILLPLGFRDLDDNYYLKGEMYGKGIEISLNNNRVVVDIRHYKGDYSHDNFSTVFSGEIKNKTEFKHLIKQLNIE